jgi:hypothetical protein
MKIILRSENSSVSLDSNLSSIIKSSILDGRLIVESLDENKNPILTISLSKKEAEVLVSSFENLVSAINMRYHIFDEKKIF